MTSVVVTVLFGMATAALTAYAMKHDHSVSKENGAFRDLHQSGAFDYRPLPQKKPKNGQTMPTVMPHVVEQKAPQVAPHNGSYPHRPLTEFPQQRASAWREAVRRLTGNRPPTNGTSAPPSPRRR
jgi:hypothetical protein